jgi:hypothetical protein
MLPLLLTSLLLLSPALAQGDLPGPPAPELTDPAAHADAVFGSDLSLTLGAGSLLGAWVVPQPHTALGLRFDAFTLGLGVEGPRVGLSIFGQKALGLLPHAVEEDDQGNEQEFPFDLAEYGALCVLRAAPSLPWGGTAGIGISRMDLSPYYGGPYPVPVLRFEGGARRHLGPPSSRGFLDVGLRLGWAEIRTPAEQLEELWSVELALGVGLHVR